MGEHFAMQIEVDYMIVAGAVAVGNVAKMVFECFISARAEDVDLDGGFGLAQGVYQGARDGAIADILFAKGPGSDDEQVDGRGGTHGCPDDLLNDISANHR